jgi:hypothetical protein
MDSIDQCIDKKHFFSYPYEIEYRYNSRGFRDNEWPESKEELENCIWCFGDSFTVGIGSPIEHTWVNILQKKSNRRCINVSMDGASNDWISRKVRKIITTINPKDIIIHWSYTSRGELSDELISDEERRIPYANVFIQDQLDNLTKNLSIIEATTKFSNVIYSFIPNAIELLDIDVFFTQWNNLKGSDWPDRPPTTLTEFKKINSSIVQELKNVGINTDQIMLIFTLSDLLKSLANRYIPYFKPLDLARDGFHYDVLTARKFVDSIIDRLSFSS